MRIQYQPWTSTGNNNYDSLCKYDIKYAMGLLEVNEPGEIEYILNDSHDIALTATGHLVIVRFPTGHMVPRYKDNDPFSLHPEWETIDYSPLDGKLYHFECGSNHYVIQDYDHDVDAFERQHRESEIVFHVQHLLANQWVTNIPCFIFPGKPKDTSEYQFYEDTKYYTLLAAGYNDYKTHWVPQYVGDMPLSMTELVAMSPADMGYQGVIYDMPKVKYVRNKNKQPVPVRISGYDRTRFAWRATYTLIAYSIIGREVMGLDFTQQLHYSLLRVLHMRLDDFNKWLLPDDVHPYKQFEKMKEAIQYYSNNYVSLDDFTKKHKPDRIGKVYVPGYASEQAKKFIMEFKDNTTMTKEEIRAEAIKRDISPVTLWRTEKELGIKIPYKRAGRSDKGKGILSTLTIQEVNGEKVVYYEKFNGSASKACSRNGISYRKKSA